MQTRRGSSGPRRQVVHWSGVGAAEATHPNGPCSADLNQIALPSQFGHRSVRSKGDVGVRSSPHVS
jgi:hypothetical protein